MQQSPIVSTTLKPFPCDPPSSVFPESPVRIKYVVISKEVELDLGCRLRGSLRGLAWGDAFGCPVEGIKPYTIKRLFPEGYKALPTKPYLKVLMKKFKTNPIKWLSKLRPNGMYSDDTQQSLLLLQSLYCSDTNQPQWDVSEYGTKLASAWSNQHTLRGFGRYFKQGCIQLTDGKKPWQTTSFSQGMGAAMKIGPLGAVFHNSSIEFLSTCAYECSLTTHGTIPASSLSFAVALIIKLLLNGVNPQQIREQLPNELSKREKEWATIISDVNSKWHTKSTDSSNQNYEKYLMVSSTIRSVFEEFTLDYSQFETEKLKIRQYLRDNSRKYLHGEGKIKGQGSGWQNGVNHGHVILGGIHAIVMALWDGLERPQRVLEDVVNEGHDTDTVGAILGSILGARFGDSWVGEVREEERIRKYADSIANGARGQMEGWTEYLNREKQLTWDEKQWKLTLQVELGVRKNIEKPEGEQDEEDEEEDSDETEDLGEEEEEHKKNNAKNKQQTTTTTQEPQQNNKQNNNKKKKQR